MAGLFDGEKRTLAFQNIVTENLSPGYKHMNPYRHINRAFIILGILIVGGLIARPFLVPHSFGQHGPYRGDSLLEEMAPEPVYYSDDECVVCHKERLEKAEGKHANVPCIDCHFLTIPHAEGEPVSFLEMIANSARNSSALVFQSLYSVMQKGWDREKLSQMLKNFKKTNPDMTVRIFRGYPVIELFGETAGEREAREKEKDIMTALREGKELLTSHGENDVRFIYPVIAEESCLECHTNGKSGDINGVIEITFPVKAKIPSMKERLKPLVKPKSMQTAVEQAKKRQEILSKADEKERQLSTLVREDAQQSADLVYESLHTVLIRGWESKTVREMVERLNKNELKMSIALFRGDPVISQYGELPGERAARESDPAILKMLREGTEMEMTEEGDILRFLYPLKEDGKCRDCHTRGARGSVLGAIDIKFPARSLMVHGLNKLADMPIDRSKEVCERCHQYLISRPKDFPQQVVAEHFEAMGIEDMESPCIDCHNPHRPEME